MNEDPTDRQTHDIADRLWIQLNNYFHPTYKAIQALTTSICGQMLEATREAVEYTNEKQA